VILEPPIEPMLAKLASELPAGDGWLFEPKWDGFRAIVFRDRDWLYLQSRDLRPLDRYFPELAAPLLATLPERCVVDGEIVIATGHGLDFDALQLRLHPAASRVAKLAAETPSSFVAFDLLAEGNRDLRDRGRQRSLAAFSAAVTFALARATSARPWAAARRAAAARWWASAAPRASSASAFASSRARDSAPARSARAVSRRTRAAARRCCASRSSGGGGGGEGRLPGRDAGEGGTTRKAGRASAKTSKPAATCSRLRCPSRRDSRRAGSVAAAMTVPVRRFRVAAVVARPASFNWARLRSTRVVTAS
jgi:hypothetical protein